MIKFSHTLFALPFAFSAILLVQRQYPIIPADIFLIILAMTGARSAAMGFNRIADAAFDAKNLRTSKRAIPSGNLSLKSTWVFVFFFSALFFFASFMLGSLCFYLSFPVLLALFFYSCTKRFTSFSHLYLGFSISLAPLGAWIAIAKTFSWSILLLSVALMTHIAGFDIIYACQDINFDRKEGLFSIPARFGIKKALFISSLFHFFSFFSFFTIYYAFNMNSVYLIAVVIIGLLFIIEHKLVKPDDLSNLDVAFFHVNSIISVILFIGILGDELFRRWL